MKQLRALLVLSSLLLGGVLLSGCAKKAQPNPPDTQIHISAAASLKDAMKDIKAQYEKKHPGVKVDIDYAGSGQIVQRVKTGAPVDGVLLASQADSDTLTKAKLATQAAKFAGNDLVLVTNKTAKTNWVTGRQLTNYLTNSDKIAIGNTTSVPAGEYAKQTLTRLGIFDRLKAKLVTAQDVRQVLSYVAAGNAQAGFVYQTDARISEQVKVIYGVPAKLHDEIGYYSGVVKATKVKKETQAFLKNLQEKPAQKILTGYGFKG